jgi:D-glycero-D-manno-heptose 1,7-bisphosphate phosphatase
MKNRVLFLDRDGIVNINKPYISYNSEFEFTDQIFDICHLFVNRNFKIIIITNQSGIGRGKVSLSDYQRLTIWMIKKFESKGIRIEFVLASALSPEDSNPSFFESFRRKPNPGMFYDAGEIIEVDYGESVMIGDSFSDGFAARSAGISKIFIISDSQNPDVIFKTFKSLADLLLEINSLMGFEMI